MSNYILYKKEPCPYCEDYRRTPTPYSVCNDADCKDGHTLTEVDLVDVLRELGVEIKPKDYFEQLRVATR